MLILTRKAGESLVLDGGIEIKITEVYGDKVRVGIEAPANVKVYRKELYATVQENQTAAHNAPAGLLKDLLAQMKKPEEAQPAAGSAAPAAAPAGAAAEKAAAPAADAAAPAADAAPDTTAAPAAPETAADHAAGPQTADLPAAAPAAASQPAKTDAAP